jgi:hypothetical protein
VSSLSGVRHGCAEAWLGGAGYIVTVGRYMMTVGGCGMYLMTVGGNMMTVRGCGLAYDDFGWLWKGIYSNDCGWLRMGK